MMEPGPADITRRTGIVAVRVQIALQIVYAGVTLAGLASLPSPDQPIGDPWITLMELLILAMTAPLVLIVAALHLLAPPERKIFSLAAFGFTLALVVTTALVHFSVLTLSRQPAFADAGHLVGFTWPSLAYSADILAWDVFFPLAALAAAAALPGPGPAATARILLVLSAALAFAGLLGVPFDNMQIRNIGILGYAVVFPAGLVALSRVFRG